MSSKLLAALPAALLLAACQGKPPPTSASLSPDPAFGESTKYNAAIQIINPDPVYAEGGAQPGDDGAKAAAAVKRYRTDAVKPVETLNTTSGASGSSGSSSNPG